MGKLKAAFARAREWMRDAAARLRCAWHCLTAKD
jgi:hypothetical protein